MKPSRLSDVIYYIYHKISGVSTKTGVEGRNIDSGILIFPDFYGIIFL